MAIDFKALAAKKAAIVEPPKEEVPAQPVVEVKKSFADILKEKAAEKAALASAAVDGKQAIAAFVSDAIEAGESVEPLSSEEIEEALPTKRELSFLERIKALKEGAQAATALVEAKPEAIKALEKPEVVDIVHGLQRIRMGEIVLNDNQMLGAKYAMDGQSFVMTGAAGTGKTTAQAGVIQMLEEQGAFSTHDFKYIGNAPSIAIVAFTKVAVRNIAKAVRKNPLIAKFADHCMTIHSLLEYEPVIEERFNDDGLPYEVRIFQPQRHSGNPLGITHLVIEEASMVGIDLWMKLYDALLPGVQIIFLGDINQLQPVFGRPVLGYALCKLPVIELTDVYRQALDNPIIANAHRVLKGQTIESSADGRVAVVTGKQKVKVGQQATALALTKVFKQLYEIGEYDPLQDMILSPWNKRELGTKDVNNAIATFLGAARGAIVHEVKAGFNTCWLAVGDRVLVDKRAGEIVEIIPNSKYLGAATQPAGAWTRTGVPIIGGAQEEVDFSDMGNGPNMDYSNFSLNDIASADDEEESKKRAASHIVKIVYDDMIDEEGNVFGPPDELSSAGDFRYEAFQFAYCMTVHKAQGSEWRKVFLILHYDHAVSLTRELIYTALTRARECFTTFAKEDLLAQSCIKADIKGNTLEAKIAYFNSNAVECQDIPLIPGVDTGDAA